MRGLNIEVDNQGNLIYDKEEITQAVREKIEKIREKQKIAGRMWEGNDLFRRDCPGSTSGKCGEICGLPAALFTVINICVPV